MLSSLVPQIEAWLRERGVESIWEVPHIYGDPPTLSSDEVGLTGVKVFICEEPQSFPFDGLKWIHPDRWEDGLSEILAGASKVWIRTISHGVDDDLMRMKRREMIRLRLLVLAKEDA